MHPRSDLNAAVEGALRAAADRVEPESRGGWRVSMRNGLAPEVRARVAGGEWLELVTPGLLLIAPRDPSRAWPLLRLNAGLSGCARVAVRPDGWLEVRGDLFVGASADEHAADVALEDRVAASCSDVRKAHHELSTCVAGRIDDFTPESTDHGDDRLARWCAEAGWSASQTGSGNVILWLEAGSAGASAKLTLSPDARLTAIVPLTPAPPSSDASCAAVALLLLRLSSAVRSVKGVIIREGEREFPAVASAWERLSSPAALDRALSALAVGCGLVRREVQALYDETLARDYLALEYPPMHAHAQEPGGELARHVVVVPAGPDRTPDAAIEAGGTELTLACGGRLEADHGPTTDELEDQRCLQLP